MSFRTVEEKRAYQRKWCKEHPDHDRKKNARKRDRARMWMASYKKTICCKACGESDPICLDFHHIDHKVRINWIATLVQKGASIPAIEKELQSCISLCANCHFKLHYDLRKDMGLAEFESAPRSPEPRIIPG